MTDEAATPHHGEGTKRELLTDREAAERMGWSSQKIQRLRLAGKLPFYPGRPPLIEPADLERLKVRREPAKTDVALVVSPSLPAAEKEAAEQRARRAWLHNRYER